MVIVSAPDVVMGGGGGLSCLYGLQGTVQLGLENGVEPSIADQAKGVGPSYRRPLIAEPHSEWLRTAGL